MPPDPTPPAITVKPHLLLLAPDGSRRRALAEVLAGLAPVTVTHDPGEAEALLRRQDVHVLVCEDELAAGETGLMFLARLKPAFPWLQSVLACGPLEPELLVCLINDANVFRVLPRDASPEAVRQLLRAALAEAAEVRRLLQAAAENEQLKREMRSLPYLVRRTEQLIRGWTDSLPRLFALAMLTFGVILATAVVTFVVLYLLKSVLGIDLIPGAHLRDWFR
jgi:DNA-binding NarL/FixJ family response regulator